MPFFDLAQQPTREIFPGVTITTAWGEALMMSFVTFAFAGAAVPTHSHVHEQMGMGLEGEFELTIDGETRAIRTGDSYLIPSNVPHSARALTAGARALDIFNPPREDYK
ncbi:MAG TPA: cupin domain-containing protein [Chthonomonadaceae bacterium]|nr:cupin domain-containing protein [Chthonomonadaceae bacterium]